MIQFLTDEFRRRTMGVVAVAFHGKPKWMSERADRRYLIQCCNIKSISLRNSSAASSRELLVEPSTNKHTSDLLCPGTDGIQPSVSEQSAGRIICPSALFNGETYR